MTDDEKAAMSLCNAYWMMVGDLTYLNKNFADLSGARREAWLTVLSRARELLAPEPLPQDVEALAKWCRTTLWDASIGWEDTDEFIKKNWCKLATALMRRYGVPPEPAPAPHDVEALAKWCRTTSGWNDWRKLATALITRYGAPPKPAEDTPPTEQRYVIRQGDIYWKGLSEGNAQYIEEAHRYTKAEAEGIVARSLITSGSYRISMVPVDPPATATPAPHSQAPVSATKAPWLEQWEAKRFPMSCIDPGWEPIADVTNSQMVLCKRRTGGTP